MGRDRKSKRGHESHHDVGVKKVPQQANNETLDLLAQATCAVVQGGNVVGTAWFCAAPSYFLTAGHIVERTSSGGPLAIQFIGEQPCQVDIMEWESDRGTGLDFAILRAHKTFSDRRVLPVNTGTEPPLESSVCSMGFGKLLTDQSTGTGKYHGRLTFPGGHLFQIHSPELNNEGYSGAPIYSEHDCSVFAIQVEGVDLTKTSAPHENTVLALPLGRVTDVSCQLQDLLKGLGTNNTYDIIASAETILPLNALFAQWEAMEFGVPRGIPLLVNTDKNAHQMPSELADRLQEESRILVIIGAQLSGKSTLAQEIVNELAKDLSKDGQQHVYHDRVTIRQINSDFQALGYDSNSSLKYRVYAIWARKVVKNFLNQLPPEERLRLENTDDWDRAQTHADNIGNFTEKHLLSCAQLPHGGVPSDFRAFEQSITDVLGPLLGRNTLVLSVEASDLHSYADHHPNRDAAGNQIIEDIWSAIKEYGEEVQAKEDLLLKPEGNVRIIITARHKSPEREHNMLFSPMVSIERGSCDDTIRFIDALPEADLFTMEQRLEFANRVHRACRGSVWFTMRYVRCTLFLHMNFPAATVQEICSIIESDPFFWYWQDPCTESFSKDHATFTADPSIVIRRRRLASTFLSRVRNEFRRNDDLRTYLLKATHDSINVSATDIEQLILPIVQLGLLEYSVETKRLVFPNPMISRHFSAYALNNLWS